MAPRKRLASKTWAIMNATPESLERPFNEMETIAERRLAFDFKAIPIMELIKDAKAIRQAAEETLALKTLTQRGLVEQKLRSLSLLDKSRMAIEKLREDLAAMGDDPELHNQRSRLEKRLTFMENSLYRNQNEVMKMPDLPEPPPDPVEKPKEVEAEPLDKEFGEFMQDGAQ